MNEHMVKIQSNTAEVSSTKNKKFEDLHEAAKQMIMNATSTDGEEKGLEMAETCKEFFTKKNLSIAKDYLIETMNSRFKCVVEIDTGLVTALANGHFLRDRADTPSNFSFFLVPKQKTLE